MKEAMYGIKGIVTNQDDEPLFAEIHLVDHDQDNSYVVTDPEIGDFHRMVEAGTYTVEVRSYGYVPQTLDNISSVDGEVKLLKLQGKLLMQLPDCQSKVLPFHWQTRPLIQWKRIVPGSTLYLKYWKMHTQLLFMPMDMPVYGKILP
jgi:hypothetical protein